MTGAGGFVGTYLLAALAESMPTAIVVGTGLAGDAGPHALDLNDAGAVAGLVRQVRPDAVIHLAAQASVGTALASGADGTWRTNLGGTLNLALAIAEAAPTAVVLFASTSEVYGRSFGPDALVEDVPLAPVNAYARSKVLAERVLADVLPETARLVVARPFNHTGPGQRENFVLPSFAAQVARIEAGLQPPMMNVGNIDVARDFLDVRDVVAAYLALLAAAPNLPAQFTCNIASGRALKLRALVEMLRARSRVAFDVVVDPARLRPSDVPVAFGSSRRLNAATGWSPAHAIETTLGDLLEHARRALAT